MTSKTTLGSILATPGALALLESIGKHACEFLDRHSRGDWGEIHPGDIGANERSLQDGSRLLSVYKLPNGAKIWIITEAEDDAGQRAATTILLPEEY